MLESITIPGKGDIVIDGGNSYYKGYIKPD